VRISDTVVSDLIHVDPAYKRGLAGGHAKVVGAFAIAESTKGHVVAAWSPGFLPVTLSFSDGRCYSLQADYYGGALSNGRLNRVGCEGQQKSEDPASTPQLSGHSLRFIGAAWGYAAWADDGAKSTIIAAPGATTFQPLFTAQMETIAIMAMNGPDWPGGNVTLVGKINGRLTVVTLEVAY
jgi:hypothetical protein